MRPLFLKIHLGPRSTLTLIVVLLVAAGAFGAAGARGPRGPNHHPRFARVPAPFPPREGGTLVLRARVPGSTRPSPPRGGGRGRGTAAPNTQHPTPNTSTPTLVWTGEQNGHLEPCGCANPQLGGMLRRAGFLRTALRGPSLRLDNGDLTAARGRQDELKAETSIQLLNQLGYAAINLGESEFRLGVPYLKYLASSFKGSLLCANARDAADQPVFAESVTCPLKVGGREVQVTVVGLISEQFAPEAEALNPGLKIAPAGETLDRLAASLRGRELVLLLFHGEPEEARRLVAGQDWISAVIAAHAPEDRPRDLGRPGEARLVNVGRDGKYLGLASLLPAVGPRGRAKLGPARGVALGPETPEDAAARGVEKLYLQRVADEKLLDRVPRLPIPSGDHYAGTAACRACHAAPHRVWSGSPHSRAWETLVHVGHHRDPDCVGCHVVGLEHQGGFISAPKTPHLEDVGCESCHRPAGRHAANPAVVRPPKVGAAACAACHIPEHSPGFNFTRYWAKIRH